MAHYRRMTIFQNLGTLRTLKKFRKLAERYFENVDYGSYGLTVSENAKARSIRSQLNLMLERVKRALNCVDVRSEICPVPPIDAPDSEEGVYLVENIFNLHALKISPQTLLDYVERAIGAYKDEKPRTLVRTFNPLFWLGILLDFVAALPFSVLSALGLNRSAIEKNPLAKLFKGCLRAAILVGALAVSLQALGYLDPMKVKAQGVISNLKGKALQVMPDLRHEILELKPHSGESSQQMTPQNMPN
jgi:hypothetical protein